MGPEKVHFRPASLVMLVLLAQGPHFLRITGQATSQAGVRTESRVHTGKWDSPGNLCSNTDQHRTSVLDYVLLTPGSGIPLG